MLATEGMPAGEHLVEHAAERPDIGPPVDHLPARLLGAHVGGRTKNHALRRGGQAHRGRVEHTRFAAGGSEHLGQPEVEHLDAAIRRQLDVRGLQVAMDDVLLVRGFDRVGDLDRQPQRLVQRQRAACDARRDRLAFDEFEHEKRLCIGFFETVNRGYVRVIERREHPGFAIEAGQPIGIIGEFKRQRLDRHVAPEARVAGAPHFAHAPFPKRSNDDVRSDGAAGSESHWCADNIAKRFR